MLADSIQTDASLNKLHRKYRVLVKHLGVTDKKILVTLYNEFRYFEDFNVEINIKYLEDAPLVSIDQISFFVLVDFLALLCFKIYGLQIGWFYGRYYSNYWSDLDFTDYDIKPFRPVLLNSSSSTREINNIMQALGFDDDSCAINNFSNAIEIASPEALRLFLLIGNLINEWEYLREGEYGKNSYRS